MEKSNKKQNVVENQDTFNKEFRPDCLGDVIGQDAVVQILFNSILESKIPNSIILQGDKGLGKTTVAKAYTKTINCENLASTIEPFLELIRIDAKAVINLDELKAKIKPCNTCKACTEFNKSPEFAGVTELDAGSEGKVDEVRNLKESLRYSTGFKFKSVIIDESHNMSTGGETALLKTVEEPPAHVIFIFATTHPDDMLPTIKDRSMILKFNGVEDNIIEKRLEYICAQKDIDVDENVLATIASGVNGGVRDAIKKLEHLSLKCKRRSIQMEDLQDVMDVEPEYIDTVLNLMFDGTIDTLLNTLNTVFSSRKLSIDSVHLDFFINKIRTKMYSSKDKQERKMLRDVYKVFVSEKERFMYNVPARTVIETAVLESFDLIEDYKTTKLPLSKNSINVDSGTKVVAPMDFNEFSNLSVESKFEVIFRLVNDDKTAHELFTRAKLVFAEEKDSLCFYVQDPQTLQDLKKVLRSELAQSIKAIAGFSGFLLKFEETNCQGE